MELLNPANLNYWQQILKNKDDIAMLKETSTHFTYAVGIKLSLKDMPFDVNNVTINKSNFHGYIINRVYQDGVTYTIQVKYNNKTYTTDMFIFFGTANGLYVMCFPKSLENGESILYLGKWNETSQSYEYCNQITTDLADAIQELTESLSNYQTKLTFDDTPTLGSNNPVTSNGIKQVIGDLTSLETTAKDNLVKAINEVKNSGGSGLELLWSGDISLAEYNSSINVPNMNNYTQLLLEYKPNGYGSNVGNFVSILLNSFEAGVVFTQIFIPNITNKDKESIYFKNIKIDKNNNIIYTGQSGYILEFDGNGSYTTISNPNGYYKIINIYGIK